VGSASALYTSLTGAVYASNDLPIKRAVRRSPDRRASGEQAGGGGDPGCVGAPAPVPQPLQPRQGGRPGLLAIRVEVEQPRGRLDQLPPGGPLGQGRPQ